MPPGTVILGADKRAWVVLACTGRSAALAPVVPDLPRYAGDVAIRRGQTIRAGATQVMAAVGRPLGAVEADVLAAAVIAAERAARTAAVVRKYAPMAAAA